MNRTIKLREYTLDDADRLVFLADNENVSRYLTHTFPCPYTKDDALWWIETGSKEKGSITRLIEYGGVFAGGVGIIPGCGLKSHVAEIGYWLGEEFWGKGIASAALATMTDEFFGMFRKFFAMVLSPNRASMRVLEKNAFTIEGVFKNEVFKAGEFHDVYRYARCRNC